VAKKKPTNKKPEGPARTKTKGAGSGESRKTRSPLPATNARKAATGKQT
jgi:hypothetical protein